MCQVKISKERKRKINKQAKKSHKERQRSHLEIKKEW